MDSSALLAYILAATALLWLPGPDWAFVLAVGARERVVIPVAAGLGIGYVLMTLVVAAGIGPLVASAPSALMIIAVGGASYLVYLGVVVLRSSAAHNPAPTAAGASTGASSSGATRLMRRGIGVSALNPKSLVLFVAFLPQFVRPAAPWPIGVQLAVLGLVWAAMGGVFYAALGLTANKLLSARPAVSRIVERIAGGAMVIGGLLLAGEQLAHLA